MAEVNPGEGYRLIDPLVDKTQSSDEFWMTGEHSRCSPVDMEMEGFGSGLTYRRKVKTVRNGDAVAYVTPCPECNAKDTGRDVDFGEYDPFASCQCCNDSGRAEARPAQKIELLTIDDLTLRDYFAGKAMASLVGHQMHSGQQAYFWSYGPDTEGARVDSLTVAGFAYLMADAMLAERAK